MIIIRVNQMKSDILDDLDDLDDLEEAEASSQNQQSGEPMPLDERCPLLTDTEFLEHMRIIG